MCHVTAALCTCTLLCLRHRRSFWLLPQQRDLDDLASDNVETSDQDQWELSECPLIEDDNGSVPVVSNPMTEDCRVKDDGGISS